MKKLIFALALIFAFTALAEAKGRSGYSYKAPRIKQSPGYVKKDGTYVQPHFKTNPNNTKLDNYSTKGNVNPFTGKEGTVDPVK